MFILRDLLRPLQSQFSNSKLGLERGHKTIQTRADELNVNHFTLKNWLKTYKRGSMPKEPASKRPEDWRTEERFQLLMESIGVQFISGQIFWLMIRCREYTELLHFFSAGC